MSSPASTAAQVRVYAVSFFSKRLSAVRNCPVVDITGKQLQSPRTAYTIGYPDTFFSIPARIRVSGRWVRGFLWIEDDLFHFTPDKKEEG